MKSIPPSSSTAPPPVRLRRVAEIVVALVVIGLLIGLVPRWLSRRQLVATTRAEAVPTVEVVSPSVTRMDLGTPLPAEVQPFVEASIHAQASGYLKDWLVDIGAVVTNGQLLAEIETPELDQQLAQARAQLNQADAALALAKITADRWTNLLQPASVSEQETAEKTADYTVQQATVEATKANVRRLEDLKSFDRVTALFDGTITVRNTDIGQLITADSGPELFHLAQTDPLRVYVRVPQTYAHAITPGQKAELNFQELPGRHFTATVTNTAGAEDSGSRTLLVELLVPNPRGEILAGGYAQVRFTEAVAPQVLVLSDNTLLFRAHGMRVAVVGGDNRVRLHSVELGRDFGNTVEILGGISAIDRVILNPSDAIADGMPVLVAPPGETNSAAK